MAALLQACGFGVGQSGTDTTKPPQTRILRIDMTPDTVVSRDTMLIHCVIQDSLDTRFKFNWLLGTDTLAVNGTVIGSYINYVAPSFNNMKKGTIFIVSGTVGVDNGSSDSNVVIGNINIPILIK